MILRSNLLRKEPFYIESDGQPVGETPLHLRNLRYVLEPLEVWYASDPQVYVAGNMFIHYVPGERNRHLSPDLFVVHGIPKERTPQRRAYLVWEEGKAPDLVIELTSASTRDQDMDDKMAIYQDILRVQEYFLFDPYAEHLDPPLRGYRLLGGAYQPIKAAAGRLPSQVLSLHLEAAGEMLRLYNPAAGSWLPIPPEDREALAETAEALRQAEAALQREAEARRAAEALSLRETEARRAAEAEMERLRREIEELRRQPPPQT